MPDPIPEEILEKKAHLVEALACGIGWLLSVDEVLRCNSREELIRLHLEKMNSPMVLTRRILRYPDKVIDGLSCIKDRYVLNRLLQFLATNGKSIFDNSEYQLRHVYTGDILLLLFTSFYKHHLNNQHYDEHIVRDYCQLTTNCSELPNLRIKSYKRIVAEHNRLMRNVTEENVPDFAIDDAQILPHEYNGYFFACITSKPMLLQEAEEMQHCVASYAEEIAAGLSIIYRISGRERATLELSESSGRLAVGQLYGSRNQAVSNDLRAVVDELIQHAPEIKKPERVDLFGLNLDEVPF